MRYVLGLSLASLAMLVAACATDASQQSTQPTQSTQPNQSTQPTQPTQPAANGYQPSEYPWLVTRVVDGDTIYVSSGEKELKVRLIGVDTPETKHPTKPVECFGPQASAFATQTLDGEYVSIVTDKTQGITDKYDRTLAYVYTTDGSLFNLDLIAGGFAYEYTYDTAYKFQEEFRAAQDEASNTQAGLWGKCR